MISYAQNFEDVTLWRALHAVSHGHYVDVGAFHPEFDSVTRWFYDEGWSGINIEPVPEMFALLAAARPRDINICAAAGAEAGTADMAVVPESMGLSSLDVAALEANIGLPYSLINVEVRPLREMLQPFAGQDIHFLKIDAEGTEQNVLAGMDFSRFRPWIIVVEATVPGTQRDSAAKWEDTILGAEYHRAYFDGLNEFYVVTEKAALARKLAVPPNCFDHFELAATVRERKAREAIERSVQNLGSQLERANQELTAVRAQITEKTQQLAASNDALVAERELTCELRRQIHLSQDEISAIGGQLRASETTIAELGEDLSELARALNERRATGKIYQVQLEQVLNSRSFRWLAPARRLRALVFPERR